MKNAKRIVVKVGTSTLAYPQTKKLNLSRIEHLIREISDLHNSGKEIIFVTSGAIAAGMNKMNLMNKPETVPENQALAAIGQGVLMHIYEKFFAEYGQTMGQVLMSNRDTLDEHARENSRNSLLTLLKMGVIPVINENDAVATDEIKIGDNDNLSAMVATIIDAEVLIILTDIDGVYTANPMTNPNAKLIDEIAEITEEIEKLAGGAGTKLGTGGMFTKIQAAKIALEHNITMLIIPGNQLDGLTKTLNGEKIGTIFPAQVK